MLVLKAPFHSDIKRDLRQKNVLYFPHFLADLQNVTFFWGKCFGLKICLCQQRDICMSASRGGHVKNNVVLGKIL